MTQNTSHAVMAQRAEPNDSLDFFPTPPWATRALCEQLMLHHDIGRHSVWEPACGQGHMLRPLAEYFSIAWGSDVHDYGVGAIEDFLWPTSRREVDWIITNPPFRLGREFAIRAQEIAKVGVALLVRTAFLEGAERFTTLFSQHRPSDVYQFCERVPMVKGRYDPKASTATSYCWIVWRSGIDMSPLFTAFHWIAPCRAKLECNSDSLIGIEIKASPEPAETAAASEAQECDEGHDGPETHDDSALAVSNGVKRSAPEPTPAVAEVQQCASAAPVKVDDFEIPWIPPPQDSGGRMSPGDVVRQRGTLKLVMAITRRAEHIVNHVCWICAWTNDDGQTCHRTFVDSALEPYVPAKKREREPA